MTVTPTLTMTIGITETNMKTNYAAVPSGGVNGTNGTNGTKNGTVPAKGPMQFEGAGAGLVGSGFAIGLGVLFALLFL